MAKAARGTIHYLGPLVPGGPIRSLCGREWSALVGRCYEATCPECRRLAKEAQ